MKYDNILPFYNTNYTIAFLNGKTGLINLDGEPLTEFIYDDLSEYYYDKESKESIWFSEHENFCIMRLNNKWGALNNKGEVIIDFKYDNEIEIRKTCNTSDFIIKFDEKNFALYDETFKQLTSEEYSYIREIQHKDRFYFSQQNGCKGIMNEKGNVLFKSNSDDKIKFWLGYDSNDHGLLIQKDNLWGFLDFDGNLKIDFIYEELLSTRLELLIAKSKNGKMGVITDNNEIILNFKYDKILYCDNGKDEYFITTLDGEEEFYNSKGNQIL